MELPSNENNQNDIQCLFSEGIKLWGTTQEVLEKQALKELEILAEENPKTEAVSATPLKVCGLELENENNELPSTSAFSADLKNNISDDLTFIESNNTKLVPQSSLNQEDKSHIHKLYEYYEDEEADNDSGSDYIPSEGELDEDYKPERTKRVTQKCPKKPTRKKTLVSSRALKVTDDALEDNYKTRLDAYYKRLESELASLGLQNEGKKDFKKLKGGLKVPKDVWEKLYEYQKEGVFWLWELHQRSSGGILGDEMGLGKTIQIIVFLHAMQYTRYVSQHCKFVGVGPSIIVCPATVIHQWVKHFHDWSPEFRVVILHQSGSHQGHKSKLIDEINKAKGIIITTYAGILKYKGNLCEYNWHYLILDEGHKIRNPTAKATIAVKQIRTPHRIMLTGSPMQNNLTELWSLFDFTNPGMLGNLATFTEHFANPILHGGFANASPMQEATAFSVASTLKNVISPFLFRRMKKEVQDHIQLPHKSEQVLFCSLTDYQRDLYKDYLMSEQVNNILGRGIKALRSDNFVKANMLMAITALRKICNHPDLFIYDEEPEQANDMERDEKYGFYKKSGKMVVVSALLKIWKKQGHRTLLFSQGRSMIKLFQCFLEEQGYKYLTMDGTTSIGSRQILIDKFNKDTTYNVFLLTTRVGGLGVNLTGANRVIIYDPDWNPATDIQARERAWRIGQEKSVTVYRLLCAGTVEEKIYQRQVWKQLLSNKVLIDPTTNKFFKSSDLFDLFSLPESSEADPETTNIFRDSRIKIQEKIIEKKKLKKDKKKLTSSLTSESATVSSDNTTTADKVEFSADKIQAMKNLAQQIAKSLSQKGQEKQSVDKPKKDAYQLELEEERNKKLKEKQKLKQLTPQELIEYNRWKATYQEDDKLNKVDDKATKGSFEDALDQSYKISKMYHKLTRGEIKKSTLETLASSTSSNVTHESHDKVKTEKAEDERSSSRKRKRSVSHIDTSGKIDGEQVEGLVKRETKKLSKRAKLSSDTHDNSILEHLFSKKGVSGALEHESVLNGGKKQHSIKVRTYAEEKALKALDAIKKSRLNNWKW